MGINPWMVLVALVALGVLWEWNRLVTLAYGSGARLWLWRLGGVYAGLLTSDEGELEPVA